MGSFDNILDDNDKVVPGPELGDVGVNTKRTLEVKDVLQDLCNHLKFNWKKEKQQTATQFHRLELNDFDEFELAVVRSRVRDRVTIALAMWGKQVVVTVAATIAVEGNDDAHDNLDQTEIEITDLNTWHGNKYKIEWENRVSITAFGFSYNV